MNVSDAKKLRALEDENNRLKRTLADAMLDNAALKYLATKKCMVRPAVASCLMTVFGLRKCIRPLISC